ncbi:SusD/RagB family nutrient-binding outer membrane lipoprotein [Sphingobacteriaceae bacterium WQ 2009]|uniref:SusD/RagB family nutrient-binding outer membrane lipoprotein n=1 Tax=Rhinopithecimicrobium faecis TaxID=2820698 RepID=A0A8T4H5X2_9SPHI|nr:SusD/RagB family nutrient-binding outer membrane lipoprotein [Sphingobacteriaceae bacterium WQ 2009]
MKNYSIKLALLGLFTWTATSCSNFLEVNVNPNAPVGENLTLASKLPAALVATATQEATQLNQLGAFWSGYWGTSSEGLNAFYNEKIYSGQGIRDVRDGIPIWENSYNYLLYYKLMLDQSEQEGALFYAGISKIMMAWHFLQLVDIYNNVPYEEALLGSAVNRPKYEDGKAVYEKSINLITAGIQQINAATVAPKQDDIIFAGNKKLWSKFGNTIKLRALLRQSEQASQAAYIRTEIDKIVKEGSGFLSSSESALVQPGYLNTTGKLNPFYENFYRNSGGATVVNYTNIRPTNYVVEKLKGLSDPRLEALYVAVNGSYKGVDFGDPTVSTASNASNTSAFKGPLENGNKPAGLLKSSSQAAVLLSSFESLFLQAEAAQRGWIAGTATKYYADAISESFKYIMNENYNTAAYLQQKEVSLAEAPAPIARIIEQKWLALNSINSIQAWADYRRLGLPTIPNSLSAPNPTARPQRLMYPETENSTNREQVIAQGSDDILRTKVWWMK